MNVVEIAKSVGADYSEAGKCYMLYAEELQAFADAIEKELVMNMKIHIPTMTMEQEFQSHWRLGYDAASKEKDAEIERLKAELAFDHSEYKRLRDGFKKEIEQLNARVAMMHRTLHVANKEMEETAMAWGEDETPTEFSEAITENQISLSATEQDVTRWVNGVKADALEDGLTRLFEEFDKDKYNVFRYIDKLRSEKA